MYIEFVEIIGVLNVTFFFYVYLEHVKQFIGLSLSCIYPIVVSVFVKKYPHCDFFVGIWIRITHIGK